MHPSSEFKNVVEFHDHQAEAVLSLLMKQTEKERSNIQAKKKEFEESEAQLQSEIDNLRQVADSSF